VAALKSRGAIVSGYSLPRYDVRDREQLSTMLATFRPHVVFHLAAQAMVPIGFEQPYQTIETNVMGVTNLLDGLYCLGRPCAVVVVTSDKVYLPRGDHAHVETDHLGGHDPYASSKAAAELIVGAYRTGFFAPDHEIAVATARAGNVIGGGDWGHGRLIPNAVRALKLGRPIPVWNAAATRPWQYVSDVIDGYLRLGDALMSPFRADYCEAWNFGPSEEHTVKEVVEAVIEAWGSGSWEAQATKLRETTALHIDSGKARRRLGWEPQWSFPEAIKDTIRWYKAAL
jgi:CDP-glucose 4,6-dehydratase